MSRYKYVFLNDNNLFHTGNKLIGNPRIVKVDPYVFLMNDLKISNPSYDTIEDLANNDKAFKQFKKRKPAAAAKIIMDENVIFMKSMVLASEYDNDQAGNMLLHLVEGDRRRKEFTGIHYLPAELPAYVGNFKVIDPPDQLGVYTASFEIVTKSGKTLPKKNITSLFPRDWSLQRLYDECLYALNHKTKIDSTKPSYRSVTKCGIPVEIHFDKAEEKIKTLYPIRTLSKPKICSH